MDSLHDDTLEAVHGMRISIDGDVQRHVQWSVRKLGREPSPVEQADIRSMLEIRGLRQPPVYDDEPTEDLWALQRSGGRSLSLGMMPRVKAASKAIVAFVLTVMLSICVRGALSSLGPVDTSRRRQL